MSSNKSIIDNLNNYFKLPIYYNKNKVELQENIASDLELIKTVDPSCNSIYSFCFNNNNNVSFAINNQIAQHYTNDISFLKDSQKLIKNYKQIENKYIEYSPNYKNIIDIWNELKIETGFKEKYYYVDWDVIEFLNKSEIFLQLMSLYNILSPIFSLIVPIIILIIPFFILKIKGIELSVNEYISVLKTVAQTNAIGKLFTVDFSQIETQERIYILVSAAFYLFSIYQNIMVCKRFNNNMKTIHSHFNELKLYLERTIENMKNYLQCSSNLETFNEFNNCIQQKVNELTDIYNKINSISEYSLTNFSKVKEIGKVLKYFYELHTEESYNSAIMYSIGFNGYIDCLEGLQKNVKERKMNFATFSNENIKKNIMKNSYYACLKDGTPVKNTIKFKKNIVITGPNASGKTTVLKSSLINIIITQQFGCGFYDSAKITPYDNLHCYLNIPDTSGRDSLFQAEARRCKDIINSINVNKTEKHLCVFDELYSGTNPDEAEKSATAFMSYLNKFENVSTMLTTHFVKVCVKLEKNKCIQNYKMITDAKNKKLVYTYKMEKGISNVKGVINILQEMDYPKEIINHTVYQVLYNQ
jgi:DNA mismatch repair ATPase MutS